MGGCSWNCSNWPILPCPSAPARTRSVWRLWLRRRRWGRTISRRFCGTIWVRPECWKRPLSGEPGAATMLPCSGPRIRGAAAGTGVARCESQNGSPVRGVVQRTLRRPTAAERLPYPVAFGVAAAFVGIPEEFAALAYLQQSVTGLVSACQRLMPLGQVAASRIIWNLKPAIREAVYIQKGWSSRASLTCRNSHRCATARSRPGSSSAEMPGSSFDSKS